MLVKVLEPVETEVEEGRFALLGPSGSGKTLALRSLYAVFGALTNSPPQHALVSVFVEELKSRSSEKPCKKDLCTECSFEVPLEAVKVAAEEAWSSLLSKLGMPSLRASVDGEPLSFDPSALCKDFKVYTGPNSFLEVKCDGKKLAGRWRWCPNEEIPYPYDRLAAELFPAKEDLAVYLPPGRGYLGTKEECKDLLEIQVCKGIKGSELEVERKVLEWALTEGDYVFVEGVYSDEEYLKTLEELLEGAKSKLVIIETRDEGVAERLGLERLEFNVPS